ncbi:MAG: hypothetical protein K0M78_10035, partial [Brevundimonas sp.]|nr:hypothetical protein [Brevundimonas sp.]
EHDVILVDEIVVTGTPVRQRAFLAPAEIVVLAGAEKARAEHAGFGHTLNALPGIANISTGEQVGR